MKLDIRDVRFEAFRGRGPGGQHKNKTETCIRAIHEPTGLVATAVNERSQSQNKAAAIKILEGKLARLSADRLQAERAGRRDEKPEAAFGAQIRTCRMCGSDQGIQDHRTGERSGLDAVKRGRIDGFIRAFLKMTSIRP